MRIVGLGILLLLVTAGAVLASVRYDRSLLQQKRAGYAKDIGYNYRLVVLPSLTPVERRRLAGARLVYPLRAEHSQLFGYYSRHTQHGSEIVLPVESLRLFSDLCTATAWLAAKHYSLSTLYDYLNMVKYWDRGGTLVAPMDALQIPANATDDMGVESRRSACFSTGVVFILAHEIAHLALQHPGYDGISRKRAQANEADADRLAVDLLARLGDLPLGAFYFFTYASYLEPHRGDFDSDDAWRQHIRQGTHPLSGQRIIALAEALEQDASRFAAGRVATLALAQAIRGIADTLNDPNQQKLRRLQGRSIRPWMLAPRYRDMWQVQPPPRPLPKAPFSGYYTGYFRSKGGVEIGISCVLFRRGDRVYGRYSYAGLAGTLSGKTRNGKLVYRNLEAGNEGAGQLRMQGERLLGTWYHHGGEPVDLELTRH